DVDGLPRLRRRDIRRHARDFSACYRDVHRRVDLVLGIDDMAALEEDIVGGGLRAEGRCQREECRKDLTHDFSISPEISVWSGSLLLTLHASQRQPD